MLKTKNTIVKPQPNSWKSANKLPIYTDQKWKQNNDN